MSFEEHPDMRRRYILEGLVHLCHHSHIYPRRAYTRCSISFERVDAATSDDTVNCLRCLVKELRR